MEFNKTILNRAHCTPGHNYCGQLSFYFPSPPGLRAISFFRASLLKTLFGRCGGRGMFIYEIGHDRPVVYAQWSVGQCTCWVYARS